MISLTKQKWIRSLEQKKFRTEYGLFIAEGTKCCLDLLELLPCEFLAATEAWLEEYPQDSVKEVMQVSKEEIRKISMQKNPQEVLAIFCIPKYELPDLSNNQQLILVLDNIQDPGNLGTILRIADWYGIDHVVCSIGTVDAYNPKTVQATMGAIGRVKIHYTNLETYLSTSKVPVYGTFLEGESLYDVPLSQNGLIVMGNEGNGISMDVGQLVTQKLFIPDYPKGSTGSESLNVGAATAIICSEFRRRCQQP